MPKVLVCGDLVGAEAVAALQNKVSKLNASAHGPFDVLFCTGVDATALSALETSEQPFAVPLWFLALAGAGSAALSFAAGSPQSDKLKATWLGSGGVNDVAGLRVAYSDSVDESDPAFLRFLSKLRQPGAGAVDVLLTPDWPRGVLAGLPPTALPPPVQPLFYAGTPAAARAAQHAEPRYHFAGGRKAFFQRPPYHAGGRGDTANSSSSSSGTSSGNGITRFISLSAVAAGDDKGEKKYLHALNLAPAASLDAAALREVPVGTTNNPYGTTASAASSASGATGGGGAGGIAPGRVTEDGGAGEPLAKRQRLDVGLSAERAAQLTAEAEAGPGGASGSQFFFSTRGGRGGRGGGRGGGRDGGDRRYDRRGDGGGDRGGHHHHGDRAGAHSGPPPDCWFCLASPSVEKHLVVAIGEETYLALPKGGVSDTHALIIPINHHDSLAAAPVAVQMEVRRFLNALASYYASKGLWLLAFERVLHRAGRNDVPLHTHMQVIGLPPDAAAKAEATFISEGQYRMLQFDKLGEQSLASAVVYEQGAVPAVPAVAAVAPGAAPPAPPQSPPAQSTCEYLYVQVPDPAVVASATNGGGAGSGSAAAAVDAATADALASAAAAAHAPAVRLLHKVPQGTKHPIQFGREVLCRLLSVPERVQWKSCAGTVEQDTAAAAGFRDAFAPFDFTLTLGQ